MIPSGLFIGNFGGGDDLFEAWIAARFTAKGQFAARDPEILDPT